MNALAQAASRGPDGMCWGGCHQVNFGALPALADGYSVWWHGESEHYAAHGPNGWESAITVDRFQAWRWCVVQAEVAS